MCRDAAQRDQVVGAKKSVMAYKVMYSTFIVSHNFLTFVKPFDDMKFISLKYSVNQ